MATTVAVKPVQRIPTDQEIEDFFSSIPIEKEPPAWLSEATEEPPPPPNLIGPDESFLEPEDDEFEISKDFADHIEGYLQSLKGMVEEGEPGRRFRREADFGTPGYKWFGFGASYPDFMLKKGWTAKRVMNAIQKALDHKKLGSAQESMVNAALEQAQEMFLAEVQEMTDWDPAEIEATINPAIDKFFNLPKKELEQAKKIKKHLAKVRKILKQKPPKSATKKQIHRATGLKKPIRLVNEYDALKGAMKKSAVAARKAMREGNKAGATAMKIRMKEIAQRALRKRKATQLKQKIKKLLKKTKPRKQAGKPVGKFTPDIQVTLDKFRNASRLTREQAKLAIENNLKEYKGVTPPSDIALENRIYSMLVETKTLEDLESLYKDIKNLVEHGQMLNALKRFNRQSKEAVMVDNAIHVITGGKGLPSGLESTGVKKAKPTTVKAHVRSFMSSLGKTIVGWKDILDMLSSKDKTSKPYDSWLNEFADIAADREAERRGTRLAFEKIRAFTMEVYGLETEHELIKQFQDDTTEVSLGIFTNEYGENVELIFTKAEARKRWMEIQDPTLDDTFREGMGYTEDMLKAINDFLTPKDKEFALKQLDFYNDYYDAINKVYRDIYGVNLPKTVNYSPIRRTGISEKVTDTFGEFFQEIPYRASVTSGSLIERVENVRPLKQVSDVVALEQHIAEMEHFKTWAKKMRELQAVFGNPKVRTAIEIEHGRSMVFVVDNFLADFTRGGAEYASRLNWLDKFRANFTRAVLAIRGTMLIKQLTSFIAYADAIPTSAFIDGVINFWNHPIENAKVLMSGELLKARGKTIDRDIKTAMRTDKYASWRKNTNNFMNTLLLNVQLGDKGAIITGGWAIYHYYRKQGLSHHAAMKKFESITESTQQSADISELSYWQRAGSFAKLFTMFLSAPNQYFRRELQAFRNLAVGRGSKIQHAKTIIIFHVLLPMLFQWVSDAFTWDADEQKRAVILGPFNGIFIVGDILDMVIRRALGLETFGNDVAIYCVGEDLAKAIKLIDLFDLTTEEMIRAIRGLAGGIGAITGKPYKAVIDIIQGANNILEGLLWAGFLELLGWTPYKAEKKD